jgi:hypothetical protein
MPLVEQNCLPFRFLVEFVSFDLLFLCVMFCRSLFVLLFFLFWPLCCRKGPELFYTSANIFRSLKIIELYDLIGIFLLTVYFNNKSRLPGHVYLQVNVYCEEWLYDCNVWTKSTYSFFLKARVCCPFPLLLLHRVPVCSVIREITCT